MALIRMLLVLLLVVAVRPVFAGEAADESLDVLRDTIRVNKKAIVDVNLTLTDAEAAQFWPLYERYQKELTGVNDRLVAVVEDYTTHFRDLSDQKALDLIGQYPSAEEDRTKIRRTYLPEFATMLPGRKVARFYQIENKIDAIVRFDLAASIPVIEER